ncbi:MAG: CAAD domain-containing protein [Leptolyngbya sp. BL-A-14]
MNTETAQREELGDVQEVIPVDSISPVDSTLIEETPALETTTFELDTTEPATTEAARSADIAWAEFQANANASFQRAIQATSKFFRENRQLLSTLGWVLLTLLGIRVVFAALDAIDDLPLVTPILKLIGLTTVGWFIWRYLLRANNRQELAQMFNRTKADLFGNPN